MITRGAKWPRHISSQLAQARGSMLDALYSVCSWREKTDRCVTELRSEVDAEEDRIRSLRPSFRATCHRLTRSCCLVWSCYCVCVWGGGGGGRVRVCM